MAQSLADLRHEFLRVRIVIATTKNRIVFGRAIFINECAPKATYCAQITVNSATSNNSNRDTTRISMENGPSAPHQIPSDSEFHRLPNLCALLYLFQSERHHPVDAADSLGDYRMAGTESDAPRLRQPRRRPFIRAIPIAFTGFTLPGLGVHHGQARQTRHSC